MLRAGFKIITNFESVVFIYRIFFTLMCSSKSACIEAFATDSSGSMFVWFNIFRTTSTFTGRSLSGLIGQLTQGQTTSTRLYSPLNP